MQHQVVHFPKNQEILVVFLISAFLQKAAPTTSNLCSSSTSEQEQRSSKPELKQLTHPTEEGEPEKVGADRAAAAGHHPLSVESDLSGPQDVWSLKVRHGGRETTEPKVFNLLFKHLE